MSDSKTLKPLICQYSTSHILRRNDLVFFEISFKILTATVIRKMQFLRNKIVGKDNVNASVRRTQNAVIFITTTLTFY